MRDPRRAQRWARAVGRLRLPEPREHRPDPEHREHGPGKRPERGREGRGSSGGISGCSCSSSVGAAPRPRPPAGPTPARARPVPPGHWLRPRARPAPRPRPRAHISGSGGSARHRGCKMPRSFLVKKHFSASKKPNYSELESQAVLAAPLLYETCPLPVIPPPEVLGPGAYYPPLVWDAGLLSSLFPGGPGSEAAGGAAPALDLTALSSEEDEGKSSGPPSPASAPAAAERFRCAQCAKAYSTFAGLSKHKQLHCDAQARKSFSCKYCEKEYVSLGALKMHIRSHTLPCVCKMCGKAFSRPWLLQGHIRTHTGEKPFSCTHCNRAFADRSNLRAHLQTHSDVKKYQCKTCSRTFSRMSLLHKHEETGCSGSR